MITAQNILRHEFIGLHAKVISSSDPSLSGLSGEVFDETKNTFTIMSKGRLLLVQKKGTVFSFTIPSSQQVQVDGNIIAIRPQDRVKKAFKLYTLMK